MFNAVLDIDNKTSRINFNNSGLRLTIRIKTVTWSHVSR